MHVRLRLGATGLGTCGILLLVLSAAELAFADVRFRDPLNNQPIDIPLPDDGKRTEAVAHFHETGENRYTQDAEAIGAGKRLFNKWCASCHLPDATGRIGPSLVDDDYRYPRTNTPVGVFEIIYAGGTGAMQSFKTRMSQDEILQVMAFVASLRKP
jgi:cytochrome c-L